MRAFPLPSEEGCHGFEEEVEDGAEDRKFLVVALRIYNSITPHQLGLRGKGVRVEGEEVGE